MGLGVLTIVRGQWIRGENGRRSCLLRGDDGTMCCLGFDALARGVPPEWIVSSGEPHDVYAPFDEHEDGVFFDAHGNEAPADLLEIFNNYRAFRDAHKGIIVDAISANDSEAITAEAREARVRELLMQTGWDDVVFVD